MKKIGILLMCISLLVGCIDTAFYAVGKYRFENEISSYWDLADKASTIKQKSIYVDKFVFSLENYGMSGKYNAIFFKTPNNSFDYNIVALKTLQQRLHEIQKMDITSFQYQTAIQQITQQEQGEAYQMIKVFKGIWWKENYPLLWNWICGIQVTLCVILLIVGFCIFLCDV